MKLYADLDDLDTTTPALGAWRHGVACAPWWQDVAQARATFGPGMLERFWGAKALLGDERFLTLDASTGKRFYVLLSPDARIRRPGVPNARYWAASARRPEGHEAAAIFTGGRLRIYNHPSSRVRGLWNPLCEQR